MKDISENDKKNNIPLVSRQGIPPELTVKSLVWKPGELLIIAGPCTVESRSQISEIAQAIKEAGATMLRGGVFKPLTFPYGDPLLQPDSDSTLPPIDRRTILSKKELFTAAEKRLAFLKEAGERNGLPVVSEILYADSLEMMSEYVDVFQVGYRHMFNMDLIEALCGSPKPVLLKRHYGESLRSLLGVAEHFAARGKTNLILCERGVSVPHTHNTESRAILDIQAIPAMREYAPTFPVVVDPSHATFKRSYVAPMAKAAIAAGADGLLIEVHPDPEKAWVDPLQSLSFSDFRQLVSELKIISTVLKNKTA
jgi:3-deoxy-7-phosphoheptulonate synthase